MTRVDPQVDFSENFWPLGCQEFTVRWGHLLCVPEDGTYSLFTEGNDWMEGYILLRQNDGSWAWSQMGYVSWSQGGPVHRSFQLQAGTYRIELWFESWDVGECQGQDQGVGSTARFLWDPAGGTNYVPVPQANLIPYPL